jgi:dienelactone hydrolase
MLRVYRKKLLYTTLKVVLKNYLFQIGGVGRMGHAKPREACLLRKVSAKTCIGMLSSAIALATAAAWLQYAALGGEARAQDVALEQPEGGAASEHAVQFQEQAYLVPVNLPGGRTAQLHARLCRPAGATQARLVVINHGTPAKPADRKLVKLGRCEQEAAQWFLRRGFAVAFALRRGYGETGGVDEENADCRHADFIRAGLQSVVDVDAVVRFTSSMPMIQPTDVIVVGQSTGGWATIAYDSVAHPKVARFINMAGGRGGHHDDMPNHNCRPDLLIDAAKYFGKTASTPMLWIYTANDSFFDPHLAASMWRAFTGAGGKAQFDQLGPYGEDGHRLFFGKGGSDIWGPLVEQYLE